MVGLPVKQETILENQVILQDRMAALHLVKEATLRDNVWPLISCATADVQIFLGTTIVADVEYNVR
jgi:hypothetical protein